MDSYLGWESLPENLLDSILHNLIPVADCIRFSVVCMAWRTVVMDNFHRLCMNRRCSSRHRQQPPLLMISSTKDGGGESRSLFSITENKFFDFQAPASDEMKCCGSSKGWLIMFDNAFKISLFNPFSTEIIKFPCLKRLVSEKIRRLLINRTLSLPPENIYENKYSIIRAELSADPTVSPYHYILMVIYGEKRRLAFIKSNDEEWTFINSRTCCLENRITENSIDSNLLKWMDDVIYYKSRFYALQCWGRLLCLEIADSSVKVKEITPPDNTPPPWSNPYLVESAEGILLRVLRKGNSKFKIYRLVDGEDGKWRWVKIRCLGDSALFLGYSNSISVLGSDVSRCKSNCIYFCADHKCNPYCSHNGYYDVGLFDVKEKRICERYHVSEPSLESKSWIWIRPTLM